MLSNEQCAELLVRTPEGIFDAYASIRAGYLAGIEASAKVCDELSHKYWGSDGFDAVESYTCDECATAIRELAKDGE